MRKLIAAAAAALICAGCGQKPVEDFGKLSDEFVYTTLSFSPVAAGGAGLHRYQDQNLDDLLDDVSPAAQAKQKKFYQDFAQRLRAIQRDALSAEDRVDLGIVEDQIALGQLDFDQIQSSAHSPTLYVELLGNALFNPYVLEYAPKPDRMRNIIARLQKVPLFLDQASSNLTSAPAIWTKVAMEENEGNIGLVDKTLRGAMPEDLRDAYARAAGPALAAMHKFQDYLKNSLSARSSADWRLGRDLYTKKFRYTFGEGVKPDDMLSDAEAELARVRTHMLELALPLHRTMYSAHKDHAELAGAERENKVIGEVLDKISERHSTPASYMEDARKDLEEARAFVQEKHLLTLPSGGNLQVVPTPEFMRGIYSVGGFAPAPVLEPQLGAFYWVTPIPADWPKERVESKLREYNFYTLKQLTIHEAMPGHYVQFEFANAVDPKSRRTLRALFGNGPYVEGWAEYITQTLLDEGFLNHAPEIALTFAKEQLRVITNAILDVRLQMLNMSEQEALDLMEKQAFQQHEEARGKFQRAQLSSCQLPMYFLGMRGWLRVRDDHKKVKGTAFRLSEFHDQALREGAVPLGVLASLLH